MKCEAFHERLNDCLDAGRQPSDDRQLRQHCLHCRECRSDLEAWQWIARSVAPRTVPKSQRPWQIAAAVGLAAGLCLIVFGTSQPAGDAGAVADHRPGPEMPAFEEIGSLSAVPPQWSDPQWSDPQWVDQWADRVAEPFAPLSQGLAPLGRSFQAVFTLLVLPGEGREAEVSPIAQPLQSKRFSRLSGVSYA